MEHRRNKTVERVQGGGWERYQGRSEIASGDSRSGEDSQFMWTEQGELGVQGSTVKGDAHSWISWQAALYLFVVGWVCVLLVPLTSFWWLALVCATAAKVALAILNGPGLKPKKTDDKKLKERELLETLAERGEITPTTAAMRTSLTVDEASKMLDELAGKGHLTLQAEDGVMAYALMGWDRPPAPGEVSASSDLASQNNAHSNRLEDPLSERELEVLTLLASGRTNAEIAKDLFVALGTVKSHVNNIYRKLDARNRAEAVTQARELNLL